MNDILFDGPFKIKKYNQRGSLIFATVTFQGEEHIIRFREKNLDKVIDYIRVRFRRNGRKQNPMTQLAELQPLKQHLRDPRCHLFLR